LTQQLGDAHISLDDHLELDLGLDSLGLVELSAALEQRFGVQIREAEFAEIFTVRELISFLEAKCPEAAREPAAEITTWEQLLQVDPPGALLRHLGMEGGLPARMTTQALAGFLGLLFRWLFDLQVYGQERLKGQGFIICPNHLSYMDGFLLGYAVPGPLRYRLFSLGDRHYFDIPVIRSLLKLIRVIPVDSARNLVEALQVSSYILRNGQILVIFPEGYRSPTGELRQFKKGVAILAKELDVKLVPAYIQGSYEAWPPGVALPRPHPIQVIFGREYSSQELKARGLELAPEASDYDAIRLGLRQEVLRLKEVLQKKRLS
jgi:long-chain acyl-CoA synthetase